MIITKLQKYSLYGNLKKYQFYKDKVQFLGFIILANKIKIEKEMIEVVKIWQELQLVREI